MTHYIKQQNERFYSTNEKLYFLNLKHLVSKSFLSLTVNTKKFYFSQLLTYLIFAISICDFTHVKST